MRRILLTGGSGFLGRNIAEHFGTEYEIFAPGHKELDLSNEDDVRKYIRENEIDIALHTANRGGSKDSADMKNIVEYNLRMFFSLERNSSELEKIIYFGSGAEYWKGRDLKKVPETNFGAFIPKDEYGFYKYVCSKYAVKTDNIYNLRLFGVYGKYERYDYRFISNAIVKNLFGADIVINQNVVFDFLYVNDLMHILEYYLEKTPRYKVYNITPDKSISLLEITDIINEIAEKPSEIKVVNGGLNYEYSGDNTLLKKENKIKFTDYKIAIRELYNYYEGILPEIDKTAILADKLLDKCHIKSSKQVV